MGNITNQVDSLGTTIKEFDLLDRPLSVTDAFGQKVINHFDLKSNRVGITYPGDKNVSYGFDPLGRMVSVTNWLNQVINYGYDHRGNELFCTNANGTVVSYENDLGNRLTGLTNASPDGGIIASYSVDLNGVGDFKSESHEQPLFPTLHSVSNSYVSDNDNRLTSIDGQTVIHNRNGDLLHIGTNTSFGFDYENRLTSFTFTNVAGACKYDGLGNRMERKVNGKTTHFVLDRSSGLTQVLVETDENGVPSAFNVFGHGLVQRISSSGEVSTYHFNLQGSTIAITDGSGKISDSFAYSCDGALANSEGVSVHPFLYLGRYGIMQESPDLLYARARHFVPSLGRFLSKDPLTGKDGDSQSFNRYVYALNNPLRFVDFSGLCVSSKFSQYNPYAAEAAYDAAYWNSFESSWGYKILSGAEIAGIIASVALEAAPALGYLGTAYLARQGSSVVASETLEISTSATWGKASTLDRHFSDHGADFGAITPVNYANQASKFLQDSQAQRLPTKIDLNGVIRVYDPVNNTFGSFNPDGTTKTFFKPSSPTYFERQPGTLIQ